MGQRRPPHAGPAPVAPQGATGTVPPAVLPVVGRRVARVLRLDRAVYAAIMADPGGPAQAAVVVAAVAAAAALGAAWVAGWHPGAVASAALAAVVRWLGWSALTALLARVLFRVRVARPPLAAALGYAQAPQLLAVAAVIPAVGPVLVVVGRLWGLAAGVQAHAAALPLGRGQRLTLSVLGFVLPLAAGIVLEAWLGGVGLGTAALRP